MKWVGMRDGSESKKTRKFLKRLKTCYKKKTKTPCCETRKQDFEDCKLFMNNL